MELEIIRFIQSFHTPFLDQVFEWVTAFGESSLIITIILGIYWCVNKDSGECVAYSFFSSSMLNNIVKNIVKAKRPIGEEGIRSLRVQTATGYSFPSGHSQGASSTYGALYLLFQRYKCAWMLLILILLVGFSRLYLGVHYPKDVIVGIILGFLMSFMSYKLFKKIKNKQLLYLITLLIAVPFVFNSSPDFARSIGGYLGFVLGVEFEMKYVKFQVNGCSWKRTVRFIIGISFLFLLKSLFKSYFSESEFSYFITQVGLMFFCFGLYPFLFSRIERINRVK
ncbi:MAG: phosphatase PAP2 family protein [Turicibacter sp.]|nr:phosphatase PAP2 family protein [Turicibacter sp.]